ncbi:MAG TPA: hypothetical protein P5077_01160 [bacterium]|nr:hypothetical protein [bacterium]
MGTMTRPLFAALFALIVACGGDSTSTAGDLGNLVFSFYSDYEMGTVSLTDASFATGVTHHISVRIKEYRQTINYSLTHYFVDAAGFTVTSDTCPDHYDTACIPGFSIKATKAGTVTVKAFEGEHDGSTLIDSVTLTFKEMADIEPIVKGRGPWEAVFDQIEPEEDRFVVEKGTQVIFVPVPLDGAGKRLLANFDCSYTFDDDTMVVPGRNVDSTPYEDDSEWWLVGPANFYFVEEGEVTLTVTETESGFSSEALFEVVPMTLP